MQEKGTVYTFTQQEIALLVHALAKASFYENEYWQGIAVRAANDVGDDLAREQCLSFSKNAVFYEQEYTKMIRKLCRGKARKQGGIYREVTMNLMRDTTDMIRKNTADSLAKLREAIYGNQISRLTCDDPAKRPEDKPEAP